MSDRRLPDGFAAAAPGDAAVPPDRRLRLRRNCLLLLVEGEILRAWLRRGEETERIGTAHLSDCRAGGTRGRWIEMLRQIAGRSDTSLVMRLPEGAGILRRDRLPRSARRQLERILHHRLDLISPWPVDRAVLAWWNPQLRGGRLEVPLAVAYRPALERALETVRSLGFEPDIVDFVTDTPDAPPRFNLLGPRETVGRSRLLPAAALLLGAFLVASGGWLGWQLVETDRALRGWTSRLAATRREMQERLAGEPATAIADRAAALLGELEAERASPLEVMESLARLFPDHIWLESLELAGRRLTLHGVTTDPGELVRILEGSPLFRNPSFVAPLVRVRRSDGSTPLVRFALTVETRPLSGVQPAAGGAGTGSGG